MAAPKYINFDDFVFNGNDNTNATTGGGGGSSAIPTTQTPYLSYIFTISSTQDTFDTIVNDEVRYNTKTVRIQKEDLVKQSYTIKVSKSGYNSNEYYTIELDGAGSTVIKNSLLGKTLGLTTTSVVLKYYVGDKLQSTQTLTESNSKTLEFKLNKVSVSPTEEVSTYTLGIFVSGKGAPVSVLKNGLKSAQFFPTIGKSNYQDVAGTTYKITSSDLSLYRITQIEISSTTESLQPLIAKPNESLEFDITLNSDYSVSILTEEVKQQIPAANPQIKLLKSDARTYNINSKLGVPIAFEKNADVKAVTVVIGDDILEFDKLESGPIGGITIPHRVFQKIGKYGVQMFPFSLSDYENQVRPETPKQIINPKEVKPKFDVVEEVKIAPTPVVKVNPYTPTIGNSGGGLGSQLILDGNFGEPFNPSKVNYGKPRENIK